MTFAHDSMAVNAMGGTELMRYGLEKRLPKELLDKFQIFISRVEEEMDSLRHRVLWCQDLPGDPASDHLKNGGWTKFHKLVFATNWQMQAFMSFYGIPWSHCVVIQNCTDPIPKHKKPNDGVIRLAYWSTPHRGLNILIPVFSKLCEKYDNIELDVYSSFELYGWGERDAPYKELFEACKKHPRINYHGSIPNSDLKKALEKTHILAYPSTWTETSCITLMEALSAGILCVHSNLGALPETAAGWTHMYQFNENVNDHAGVFYNELSSAIEFYWNDTVQGRIETAKTVADIFYNWESCVICWEGLLRGLLQKPVELPDAPKEFFSYKT